MIKSGYETRKARVEMLPLIDVIFLLLVYFIYAMASMVVNKGIKVELPFAKTRQVDISENVSVSIGRDNSIFVDKDRVEEDRLIEKLLHSVSNRKNIKIVINGHRNADLGIAIKILDLVRSAGINEVSFASIEEPL